jgi:hypothetical protein
MIEAEGGGPPRSGPRTTWIEAGSGGNLAKIAFVGSNRATNSEHSKSSRQIMLFERLEKFVISASKFADRLNF